MEANMNYEVPASLWEAFEKATNVENKTNGHRGNAKGKEAEKKCLHAIESLCAQSSWLSSARAATLSEEARGIDIVVETKLGLFFIQVKSSHYGARCYRRERPKSRAIVIIVNPGMSEEKVRNKANDALYRLRRYIRSLRKR
jgi:hypothetical protein